MSPQQQRKTKTIKYLSKYSRLTMHTIQQETDAAVITETNKLQI